MRLNIKKIRQWVETCDSVADAAERIGMSPTNLFRLLRGDNNDIRISTLGRLADVMRIEPAELLLRAKIV